jgi:hypothetical protein
MKQQQIFERESMGDKRTPRSRDAANALFHSLDHAHTPTHHTPSHASSFWKHASFGEPLDHQPDGMIPETPERVHGKFAAHTADVQSSHHQQPHFLHHPTTPGSAVETVTHQDSAGSQDDDGVSSELTADAGEQLLVMCDIFLSSLTMCVSLSRTCRLHDAAAQYDASPTHHGGAPRILQPRAQHRQCDVYQRGLSFHAWPPHARLYGYEQHAAARARHGAGFFPQQGAAGVPAGADAERSRAAHSAATVASSGGTISYSYFQTGFR